MNRTVGLTLLLAAWIVVLLGMRFDHVRIPIGRSGIPVAYLGVPLLVGALFLLLREYGGRRPRN